MKLFKRVILINSPWEHWHRYGQPIRTLKLKPPGNRSHYDALGIPPSATQEDIKNAYYKLSKLYHPDRNKGSEIAAQHFRTINDAYEILGNFKKRRMYDKGIPTGSSSAGPVVPEEVDPQTRFYRSRGATPTGKTPIYDFDEWSKVHYGAAFRRREAAKEKFEKKLKYKQDHLGEVQMESIIYLGIAIFMISAFVHHMINKDSHDVDNVSIKKKNS